jgi:hypothetical protein
VTPGFEFQRVDALVTNFHTAPMLLALVMAFAGVEARGLPRGDRRAVPFYSFGDAMLPCDGVARAWVVRGTLSTARGRERIRVCVCPIVSKA